MDARFNPGERYWRVLDSIGDKINIYDGPQIFLDDFGRVPVEVGNLFAAHWHQAEVCNGGFLQFFHNSTGVLAPEALAAYRAMGLSEWAMLLEEAMGFFGVPYPRERELRQQYTGLFTDKPRRERDPFSTLDHRFFAWLHAEKDRWERAADSYADSINI